MKKAFLILATMMVLAVLAGGSWAYTFDNHTTVLPYQGNNPTGAPWRDVIGDVGIFETYGANLSGNTLTIFTNWDPGDIGYLGVKTADLFVDIDPGTNPGWDYAINLTSVVKDTSGNTISFTATIVAITGVQTSQGLFSGSGLTYGGRYDLTNGVGGPGTEVAGLVPVNALGTDVGTTTVTWTNIAGTAPDWTIAFNLGDLPGFNATDFAYLWATGTCANDTSQGGKQPGAVPLPGALLLLGAGLVRLATYRRRTRLAVS